MDRSMYGKVTPGTLNPYECTMKHGTTAPGYKNNISSEPLLECNTIPLIVVEEHNEVADNILHAMHKRHLPVQGLSMIYFDAHINMLGYSNRLPIDLIYHREEYSTSYIQNWLLPLIFAGHFDKIAWFKPPWSQQIKEGTYKWIVGKDIKSDFIRLNAKENYCLYQSLYRNENDMTDNTEFGFDVISIGNKINQKDGFPGDNTEQIQRVLSEITDKYYILDIDLDFFSTRNPYLSMYTKADMYQRVSKIYCAATSSKLNPNATDEEIYEFMENHSQRLNELESVTNCFDSNEPIPKHIEGYRELMELKAAIESSYSSKQIDWSLIHSAGVTAVTNELPDFESSPEQLKILFKVFEDFLDNLVNTPPRLITIARSHEDCIGDNASLIELNVIEILRKKFKNMDEPNFTESDESSEEVSEMESEYEDE